MNNNITLTRGQIGQFGSFLAGSGLLTGSFAIIAQANFPVLAIPAVLFIVGIGLWVWMTPQDFQDFVTGRRIRYGTVSAFSTLLLIGIVALVYIIIQREVIIVDMTIDERFSLAPESIEITEAAKRSTLPIQITGFYYPDQLVQREIDDQYYQLYENATDGHISRRYINPIEEPAISESFLPFINQGINVFVSYLNEDDEIIGSAVMPVNNSGLQEEDVTQAIAKLLVAGQFKVYFETSTGTPDPLSTERDGFAIINNFLRGNGLITDPLSLETLAAQNRTIPQDASAVILAQPRRQLTESEITVIDEYLKRGGSLFIAADIFFADEIFMAEDSNFNSYLWENYGIRMGNEVLVDPASSGATALDVVSAAVFGNSAIGRNLNIEGQPDSATQFRLARAVEVQEDDPPVQNGRVIMTSPQSWGETDIETLSRRNEFTFDEDEDTPAPLTSAAWAFDEAAGTKIVLVGDGDFMTNGLIQAPRGNSQLVLDSIGWMTGFTEQTEFAPQPFLTTPLIGVSGQMLDAIAFITVILMPGLMIFAAIIIYLRRLRR